MNSLGSLEQHAHIMAAWEKGLMKLDISLEVKYVLCAPYHVTANLKTKGYGPSQCLAVVRTKLCYLLNTVNEALCVYKLEDLSLKIVTK